MSAHLHFSLLVWPISCPWWWPPWWANGRVIVSPTAVSMRSTSIWTTTLIWAVELNSQTCQLPLMWCNRSESSQFHSAFITNASLCFYRKYEPPFQGTAYPGQWLTSVLALKGLMYYASSLVFLTSHWNFHCHWCYAATQKYDVNAKLLTHNVFNFSCGFLFFSLWKYAIKMKEILSLAIVCLFAPFKIIYSCSSF